MKKWLLVRPEDLISHLNLRFSLRCISSRGTLIRTPSRSCLQCLKVLCQRFFINSLTHFRENIFPSMCIFQKGEELNRLKKVFAKVWVSGSMWIDVCHTFSLELLSKKNFQQCKGKYPLPTLAMQAIVDHNKSILCASSFFWSSK